MSNGNWIGRPEEGARCWCVELGDHRGAEYVHADDVRVDHGCLVFTSGSLREHEGGFINDVAVKAVYGPGHFAAAWPLYECIHEDNEDDE